jgi:response regulator RpfG family c-di-GMP phosphodiesterase
LQKPSKSQRAIKPLGQRPVIAGRVPASLHQKIKRAAKASGRTMSDELAYRAEQSFQWENLNRIERGIDALQNELAAIGVELLEKASRRIAEHEARITELERTYEETLGRIIEAAVARALASKQEQQP